MDTYTLSIYTALDITTEAIPFRVDGKLNPAIPRAPGVYVFLESDTILYVGKAGTSLRQRLDAYKREALFARVWWHLLEASWVDVYEQLYLRALDPPLNGSYHPAKSNRVYYRGKLVYEHQLSLAEREEAHDAMQQKLNDAIVSSP